MQNLVSHIPILTTLFALVFAIEVLRRYRMKGKGTHLLWWAAGMLMYGAGTFAEGYVTLFGWNEKILRWWYITGALLGGMPLAQGTVYLLMKRKLAHILTFIVVPVIILAATCVLLSPIDYAFVETNRLTGKALAWQWVRLFSPFINTYALSSWSAARLCPRIVFTEIAARVIASLATFISLLARFCPASAAHSRASATPKSCMSRNCSALF